MMMENQNGYRFSCDKPDVESTAKWSLESNGLSDRGDMDNIIFDVVIAVYVHASIIYGYTTYHNNIIYL